MLSRAGRSFWRFCFLIEGAGSEGGGAPHPSLRARLEFLEAELVAEGMFSEPFSSSGGGGSGETDGRLGSSPLAGASTPKPDARITEALRYA